MTHGTQERKDPHLHDFCQHKAGCDIRHLQVSGAKEAGKGAGNLLQRRAALTAQAAAACRRRAQRLKVSSQHAKGFVK